MGEYKVCKGDDGIIRGILLGVHEKRDAESIIKEITDLSEEKGKARVLIDLSKTERGTLGARKVHLNNIKVQPPTFEKLALFGANTTNKVMVNFIVKATGRKNKIKYFKTEEEALRWLRE